MFLHSHYVDRAFAAGLRHYLFKYEYTIEAVEAHAITLHLPVGEGKGNTDEVVLATLFCTVIRSGLLASLELKRDESPGQPPRVMLSLRACQ